MSDYSNEKFGLRWDSAFDVVQQIADRRVKHWAMLRHLMQHYGNRAWLEKAIERAFKKVAK